MPAGRQTRLHELPLNEILSPNGRHLLITEDGRETQYLQVVSVRTGLVTQSLRFRFHAGLYVGLAYDPAKRVAYASGGGQNVIHTYSVSPSWHLTATVKIKLQSPQVPDPFPSGLALSPDGALLYVAEEDANAVAVVDTSTQAVVKSIPVGNHPYGLLLTPNGHRLYVSNWAGHTVSLINTLNDEVAKTISVGAHPVNMALGPTGLVYVADANADEVTVLSPLSNTVVDVIHLSPFDGAPLSSSPEALAVGPSNSYLYVACGGENAVDVIKLEDAGERGGVWAKIPTGEYPTQVVLSATGRRLFVLNGKGTGSKPNAAVPIRQYGNVVNGTLSVFPVPDWPHLPKDTKQVARNNNVKNAFQTDLPHDRNPFGSGRSPIKHVIYVLKENKTYDYELGDVPAGDGNAGLATYGGHVTPNLHALVQRFGLFDNFYDDGQASADGHNWAMSANSNDFNVKLWPEVYAHRNERAHSQGKSKADISPGGDIWDAARRAGIRYMDYGEFGRRSQPGQFIAAADAASCAGPVATVYFKDPIPQGDVLCLPAAQPQPTAPNLTGHYDPHYPSKDYQYSDLDRFSQWDQEFNSYVQHDNLPSLEIVYLPNDHGTGASGYPTPTSSVAMNDEAVGKLVDAVSHSKYWASTAIFITEDDAQGARDHVNAQRTVCLVVSPYTQTTTPVVEQQLYDNASMLRTMELILHLKPMSQYDATARPMWTAFHAQALLDPYTALPMEVPLSLNP